MVRHTAAPRLLKSARTWDSCRLSISISVPSRALYNSALSLREGSSMERCGGRVWILLAGAYTSKIACVVGGSWEGQKSAAESSDV